MTWLGRLLLSAVAAVLLVTSVGPTVSAGAPEVYQVPAGGVLQLAGAGWGHGRGMSQWGAYQAATEGHSAAEILGFYYPGTTLARVGSQRVRVLLAAATGPELVVPAVAGLGYRIGTAAGMESESPTPATPPAGCPGPVTSWRAVVADSGLLLQALCGSWVDVRSAAGTQAIGFEVAGGITPVQVAGARRGYRGQLLAHRSGRSLRVLNVVAMEDYLRAVVPAEVSPSWPAEALAAQAVAARTFASHEVAARGNSAFDVYDSTYSQSYPGARTYLPDWTPLASREDARCDAAIAATAELQLLWAGSPALTQFSASNGAVTAAGPLPYQLATVDPWDARAAGNPRRAWVRSVPATALASRYRLGRLRQVEVLARDGVGDWGGRILAVRLVGTRRAVTVRGDSAIRSAFGVHSSNFTITG